MPLGGIRESAWRRCTGPVSGTPRTTTVSGPSLGAAPENLHSRTPGSSRRSGLLGASPPPATLMRVRCYGRFAESPVQGSTTPMSMPSKSRTWRVTTVISRDRVIAAIRQSAGAMVRPAERRAGAISAYSRAAWLSNGRIRFPKSSRRIASMAEARVVCHRPAAGRMATPQRSSASPMTEQ